eukprot:CAMPEP_0114333892 /NCGR_PEP_ID=MMETSP0101-20121206/4037_1 /TAXON_ID=38822 ORGANISM="Pteridomonas danica, Strain PT" /NCGR_SAMPLE_ID=MMETSP0101 /ASSEMBLY_ACC=CAM_ASM_000211 /LENGTH=111 /DNA_ID=CAMNT_0001465021 /DNA_START=100 /DNA_END=435 /DNA_ORIENTATION=-
MPAKKRNTEKKSDSSATADTDASLQTSSIGRESPQQLSNSPSRSTSDDSVDSTPNISSGAVLSSDPQSHISSTLNSLGNSLASTPSENPSRDIVGSVGSGVQSVTSHMLTQ